MVAAGSDDENGIMARLERIQPRVQRILGRVTGKLAKLEQVDAANRGVGQAAMAVTKAENAARVEQKKIEAAVEAEAFTPSPAPAPASQLGQGRKRADALKAILGDDLVGGDAASSPPAADPTPPQLGAGARDRQERMRALLGDDLMGGVKPPPAAPEQAPSCSSGVGALYDLIDDSSDGDKAPGSPDEEVMAPGR